MSEQVAAATLAAASAANKAELFLSSFDGVPGRPGESQDKGKEAQEGLRRAREYSRMASWANFS